MPADGAWFHLTSPPPKAGNLEREQHQSSLGTKSCGQVAPSASHGQPQQKRKLAKVVRAAKDGWAAKDQRTAKGAREQGTLAQFRRHMLPTYDPLLHASHNVLYLHASLHAPFFDLIGLCKAQRTYLLLVTC